MASIAFDVLVVDDDDSDRTWMVNALQQRPQLRLDQASSKAQALELCMVHQYDLVLSDIKLEAATAGVELLQAIKKHSPSTAVILLSAYGTLTTAIGALRESADNYLLKPFSMAELEASVARALERRSTALAQQTALRRVINSLQGLLGKSPEQPNAPEANPQPGHPRYISAAALELDLFQRRATLDGVELELTVTEWGILHELLRAGGQVVTFEQLAAQTHQLSMSRESARTLLASHVRNLRRKLGAYATRLVNIRGTGFCLSVDEP